MLIRIPRDHFAVWLILPASSFTGRGYSVLFCAYHNIAFSICQAKLSVFGHLTQFCDSFQNLFHTPDI